MGSVIEIALGSGTPMTHDEKLFFKQIGARMAALRKDQSLMRNPPSAAGTEAATADRTHPEAAKVATALRHGDARYRSTAG
jgi:hypothetical protein